MFAAKNNLADTPGLAYRLTETTVEGCSVPLVEWESAPVRVRLDNLGGGGRDKPATDEATAWLRANLIEPTPATEIVKRAGKDGISKRTLERSKKSLGITSGRLDQDGQPGSGDWHWFPPPTLKIAENNQQENFVIGPD